MTTKTLNKVKDTTTKYEPKVRLWLGVVKGLVILGAIGMGLFYADKLFTGVSNWRNNHKIIRQKIINIKFELKFNYPYRVEEVKEVKKAPVMPVEAKKEKELYPAGFEEAYDKVWLMESGRGTNKAGLNGYCIAKGEINEIGYAPHDKYCFKDREEQKSTFMTWLTNRINKVKMPWCETVSQCLTIYSSNAYSL